MTNCQALFYVLCAFQSRAHTPIHSRLQMGRLEAKKVLLCPLISFWLLCNEKDLFSWKLPSCKITFAWNSQPPATILQQIFSMWTLLSVSMFLANTHPGFALLFTAGPTSLCFFNAGICQGWLSQSRKTQCTLSTNALPLLFGPQCVDSHSHSCAPQIQTSTLISCLHVVLHL